VLYWIPLDSSRIQLLLYKKFHFTEFYWNPAGTNEGHKRPWNGYLSPELLTYSLSFTEHLSFSARLVYGLNRLSFVDLDPSSFSVAFLSVGASPMSVNVGQIG